MFQKWTPSFSGAERQNLDVWIWSETRRSLELASSVLKRLFPGQGPGCKALRLQRKAAEADDAEIKGASSPPIHVTLRHAQADYSDKQALSSGAEAKWRVFCSLSLRSGFSSLHLSPPPHAHVPPPRCWWSRLLKSAICSIIFNYPAIAPSIIPLSSIVCRNHLLIDSKGQLEAGWKLKPLQ